MPSLNGRLEKIRRRFAAETDPRNQPDPVAYESARKAAEAVQPPGVRKLTAGAAKAAVLAASRAMMAVEGCEDEEDSPWQA